SVERVLGYSPDMLIGQSLLAFVHSDDVDRVRGLLGLVQGRPHTPTALVFRFRQQDASWRVLEAVANNLLDDPDVQGIVANARDITERRRTEERLQSQLALLAAMRTIDQA